MTTYNQQMAAIKAAIETHEDMEKRYAIDLSYTLNGLRDAMATVAAAKAVEFIGT